MKLLYNGREVNRIVTETVNDDTARGGYFIRKRIEFADGDKLYARERITAGANIKFLSGANTLISYFSGEQNIEGKEAACSALVLSGTGAGRRLDGALSMTGGSITIRLSLIADKTAGSVRLNIGGRDVAEVTGMPLVLNKQTAVITLTEAVT